MDIYQLLDEGERFKLSILRYLELTKEEYITVSRLKEVMGLSQFKIVNYLESLMDDLYQFDENPRINIYSDEIVLKNINLKVVKELQIEYFKRSHTIQLLLFLLEGQGTTEKFSKKNYVSTSKTYSRRKDIVRFLKKYTTVKVKKSIIIGNEVELRNVIFSLLSEAFNGYYYPFSEENRTQAKEIITYFISYFQLRLTSTQYKKLQLFIGIIIARMKTKKTLESNFFQIEETQIIRVLQYFKGLFPDISREALVTEISYILFYLSIEYTIEHSVISNIDYSQLPKDNQLSKKIATDIIRMLEEAYNFKCPKEVVMNFQQKIKKINLCHQYFEFYSSSFSTKKQIKFIYETYPVYSKIIEYIILRYINDFPYTHENMKVRLFYDYTFLLVRCLPVNEVEEPIHVCVDFSQGTNYTEYIIKEVAGFENLNLIVERKLTVNTDIYISDYLLDNLIKKQIIWKNPPTPGDWKYFGDTVVKVKQEKLLFNKEGDL